MNQTGYAFAVNLSLSKDLGKKLLGVIQLQHHHVLIIEDL